METALKPMCLQTLSTSNQLLYVPRMLRMKLHHLHQKKVLKKRAKMVKKMLKTPKRRQKLKTARKQRLKPARMQKLVKARMQKLEKPKKLKRMPKLKPRPKIAKMRRNLKPKMPKLKQPHNRLLKYMISMLKGMLNLNKRIHQLPVISTVNMELTLMN